MPYAGDFRSRAINATAARLGDLTGDPLQYGISVCVPAAGEGEAALKHIRRVLIVLNLIGWAGAAIAVLVFLGLLVGTFILVVDVIWMNVIPILFATLIIAVAALIAMLSGIVWSRRAVRRVVEARHPNLASARYINIEDGSTFGRMKFVAEDMGLMWADSEFRCLRIEGVTHRYLICARDVIELVTRKAPGMVVVMIRCRISDDAEIALALSENQSNILEILKQAAGIKPRTYNWIRRAVGTL